MTADGKYSLFSRDNSMQTIQIHLVIGKTKNFSLIFVCTFQIYIKFWTFLKTDDLQSLYFSEVTDPEKRD